MAKEVKNQEDEPDPLQRMDEALKAAMKMPPRKHKDEPKRRATRKKASK